MLGTLASLSACAVGPDFERPHPQAPAGYVAADPVRETVSVPAAGGGEQVLLYGHGPPAAWWRLFDSAALDGLVAQAVSQNLDLAAARARLRRTEALLRADTGLRYPMIGIEGDASRQRPLAAGSASGGSAGGGGASGSGAPGGGSGSSAYNVYTASGVVSYNLDLFGREDRLIEAQAARTQQQRFEVQAAYLSLIGNVVSTTLAGAALRAEIALRQDLIAAQDRRLRFIDVQVAEGYVARADLVTARADLAAVRAPLPVLAQRLAENEHRLALLVGRAPGGWAPPPVRFEDLELPRRLPVTLPSILVRQRPDILAAESALHAASAEIGVATADLYPQITLTASFGVGGVDLPNLPASLDPIWTLGAGLAAPIFQGGRLRALRDAAVMAFEAALAEYRQTVLDAFVEVADALRAIEHDARALRAQHEAVEAAQESLDLAEFRFEAGVVDYVDVLIARQQYQEASIAYVNALGRRYQDTAALFAALGGAVPQEAAALHTAALRSAPPTSWSTVR